MTHSEVLEFLERFAISPLIRSFDAVNADLPFAHVRLQRIGRDPGYLIYGRHRRWQYEIPVTSGALRDLCLNGERLWAGLCMLDSHWFQSGWLAITFGQLDPERYVYWSEESCPNIARAALDVIRGDDCLEKFIDFALDNDDGRHPNRVSVLESVAARLNQLREGAPS